MEPLSVTVTAVLSALRTAREIAKHVKDSRLTESLQKAYDLIGEIRHQIFGLEDENRRLVRELEELRETKKIESELKHDGKVYWRVVNGKDTGPFCKNCWHENGNHQLVPLQHQGGGAYFCTIHKMQFGGGSSISAVIGKPLFDDREF